MFITMNENAVSAMNLLLKGSRNKYGVPAHVLYEAVERANIATKILDTLDNQSPMRATEITDKVAPDYNTQKIVAILNTLVAAGALKRVESPDEKEFIQFDDNGFGKMVQIVRFALK